MHFLVLELKLQAQYVHALCDVLFDCSQCKHLSIGSLFAFALILYMSLYKHSYSGSFISESECSVLLCMGIGALGLFLRLIAILAFYYYN